MNFDAIPPAAIVTGTCALFAPTIAQIVSIFLANRNAHKAAEKVQVVATTLAEGAGKIDEKLADIHVLVNSRLTEALKYIHELELLLREATGRVPQGEPPIPPPI